MAALTVQQRSQIWRGAMRYWSAQREATSFSKYDLYNPGENTGAIANLDDWFDTHSGNTTQDNVGVNGSLSVAMRSALTLEQKGLLVMAVAAMRTGNIDFMKRALSAEID